MRRVRLPGTTLDASVLGFGCAHLMGRLGRRESLRKLEAAYAAGITHFDTARSYGYGEAESALGDFIATRRERVTVTTKLGIAAPTPTRSRSLAKAGVRKLAGRSPRLRGLVRRQAGRSVTPGRFDVREARASLETSLQEMRTDRVDLLLLHDCNPRDLQSDELLEFLAECVQAGKVRYFGIATDLDSTAEILRSSPGYARVIQVPNSVVERNLERLPARDDRPLLTHSAVRAGLTDIRRHLTEAPDRASTWSDALAADCSNPDVLSGLMLAYAVRANPGGIVLYGSQNEHHIRTAASAIEEDEYSADQIARFAELVEEGVRPSGVEAT
jgi:aryl-alcohol dehydrogenase-like predicted oxidoreductase